MPLGRRSARGRGVASVLALTVLALGGSLLLVGRHLGALGEVVLGSGGDPYQTLWRFQEFAKALARGSLAIQGEPFRNFGPLPWIPLHALVGEPWAYNLVWIAQAPLAAVSTYALGRLLGLGRFSAGLAGLLTAFAPYRIAQSLGHFGAMQLFWIPAVLAAALAYFRRPHLVRAGILGLLLAGTSWTEHTLFLTTLLALGALTWAFRSQLRSAFRWGPAGVLALLVFTLALLPFAEEFKRIAAPQSSLTPPVTQRLRFTPTMATLFALPPFHLTRVADAPYGSPRASLADHVHFVGILAPLLAVVSLLLPIWNGRRAARSALVLLALVGTILAFAPRIPPLAILLEEIPPFSAVRAVNRFLALPVVAIPLLAAGALETMLRATPGERGRRAGTRRVIAGAVLALLLFEIAPGSPFPSAAATIPPFYRTLAAERPGPLLEIPAATDYLVASGALYASTLHGRVLLGSSAFERVMPTEDAPLLRVPVLRDLLLVRVTDLERPTFFGQDPRVLAHAALASEGVVAVVLHREAARTPALKAGPDGPVPASTEELDRVRAFLRAAGFAEEQDATGLLTYRIPPWPETASAVVSAPGNGWPRAVRRPDGVLQTAVTTGADLEVRILGGEPRSLVLSARVVHGSKSARVSLTSPVRQGSARARPGAKIELPIGTLPPGAHRLTIDIDADEIIIENPSVHDVTSPLRRTPL